MSAGPSEPAPPLWYKDAVIYQLPITSFFDANNDGIGDLPGLIAKLDYIRDLGVSCIWLMPFFPSPWKDDGYDISDFESVHPRYGTVDDFRRLLAAAHERGIRIVIELVLNHTSDQHEWFRTARLAPEGSPERSVYVWSPTEQKYTDAPLLLPDTETSNWTWDPEALAFYWHRFSRNQPDLNYEHPAVLERMLRAIGFWLDLGVDGLRLDAAPYLVEREGSACENLPETHDLLKAIRGHVDARWPNRLLLVDAKQPPSEVSAYFGAGDECHMAYHLTFMLRLFIAVHLEDRGPIVEAMADTPAIPEECQWALFLRNHDELALDMLSEEEQDYLRLAFATSPEARRDSGIRRRLAPLMNNSLPRIELLASILFSFPGTPIIYYGDEIGMGDNVHLGGRSGVRTPMQWNGDRNGGFSRADPQRLYSPVILDPVYGYHAVNVEAAEREPTSLLQWMKNMIRLRGLFRVFGRGGFELLEPDNPRVLAYLRRDRADVVLCVANLAHTVQPVMLDLSAFEGMVPVEMLGYTELPRIGTQPYFLTLGPYGFYWFELQRAR